MAPGTDYSDTGFIVVTAYNRLPLTHSLLVYAVQQQLIKAFQDLKAQLVITRYLFSS